MEPGYYWIKPHSASEHWKQDEAFPARWDGEKWHHHGLQFDHAITEVSNRVVSPDECQTGCTCTQNPDGTITVKCGGKT